MDCGLRGTFRDHAAAVGAPVTAFDGGVVSVHAAGSLRPALNEIGRAFEARTPGVQVRFTFGASGLLKDRLLQGEPSDVFASANLEHPQELTRAGRAGPVTRFARNSLCALVRPGLDVTTETLVDRMLDPAVRVGTSTPRADPSGDYAWALFDRVEQSGRTGARKRLAAKALQLTGSTNSPLADNAPGRSIYTTLVAGGKADVFLTYCTSVALAVREEPSLRRVDVPTAIQVDATYGVTVLDNAAPEAKAFVAFMLSTEGQRLLNTRLSVAMSMGHCTGPLAALVTVAGLGPLAVATRARAQAVDVPALRVDVGDRKTGT